MGVFSGRDKVINAAYKKLSAGALGDALTILRRGSRGNDPKGSRLEAMAFMLYQAGRWKEAADAYGTSLAADPASSMRLFYLASSLARAGQVEQAITLVQEWSKAHPDDVAAPSTICLVRLEQNNFAAAREAYNQARDIFARADCQSPYSMGLMDDCAEAIRSTPPEKS